MTRRKRDRVHACPTCTCERKVPIPATHYHKPGHASRMARKWQAEVRDQATRKGTEWTGADLKIALDRSIAAREVAKQLGRTLYAVRSIRYKDNKAKRLKAGTP